MTGTRPGGSGGVHRASLPECAGSPVKPGGGIVLALGFRLARLALDMLHGGVQLGRRERDPEHGRERQMPRPVRGADRMGDEHGGSSMAGAGP